MARCATISILAAAALAAAAGSAAAQGTVQAGVLECRGAPSVGYIVGSQRWLDCVFRGAGGAFHYRGVVQRVGLDVGFSDQSALGWAVFAPTQHVGPGDLSGVYSGVGAAAAVGVGLGANAMVGGSGRSFSLQPLSFEGQTGFNASAGLQGLELQPAQPYVGPRGFHRHVHHVAAHRVYHHRHPLRG
jgi:hypothetical protein